METISAQQTVNATSGKAAIWSGRIISALVILFLLVDAIMKVLKATPSMEGSVKLGFPENAVQGIGIVLLISTVLYTIPRTAVLGAVLVTAYLGGATAIMVSADEPYYFPIVFGILTWAGLYLRDSTLRSIIPFKNY
jgi:hypothetical protein